MTKNSPNANLTRQSDISTVQSVPYRRSYSWHPTRKRRKPHSWASLISKHANLIKTLIDLSRAKPDHYFNTVEMRLARARGSLIRMVALSGETPAEAMIRIGLTAEQIALMGPFYATVTVKWSAGLDPEIEKMLE